METKISDYTFQLEINNEKYKKTEKLVTTSTYTNILNSKVYYVYKTNFEDFKEKINLIDIDFESYLINGYKKEKNI